jgi:hypothetical protein
MWRWSGESETGRSPQTVCGILMRLHERTESLFKKSLTESGIRIYIKEIVKKAKSRC